MNDIQTRHIIDKFNNTISIGQFADLLNLIEKYKYDSKKIGTRLTARDLTFLFITKDKRYKTYEIPKKNGKKRIISSPDNYLLRVQTLINILFQMLFSDYAHNSCNGFIYGRNIKRNAEPHVNKRFVLNIDIKDFFPSIKFRRIKAVMGLNPFNLNEDKERLAFIISNLATYKGVLPQGAPTSPIISNIVTQKLDRRIHQICKTLRVKYSRYADDLTFSSNRDILDNNFISKISEIITSENFEINDKKTRLRSSMNRQEVTGLIVNRKVNINREYLQTVRAMINNWDKRGLDYATINYQKHCQTNYKNVDFRKMLRGRINFIGEIKGKDSSTYHKLITKFEYLFYRLDYDSIKHPQVKARLIKDNLKMEMILLDNIHLPEDKFISFCTSAFHQIENLLNYYYWQKFPDINDFKKYMLANNPAFLKKWKNIDRLGNYKKIGDFDINLLVYLFEKENYFDKKIYYNNEITFLREIRNDDSHRCSVYSFDKKKIIEDYKRIQEKWTRFKEKKGREPEKQKNEIEIEFKIRLLEFIESKNYNQVRKILNTVIKQSTGANILYIA